MEELCIHELKIEAGFKLLIPPLSAEELKQLEEDIILNGCLEPICIWGNTILDGHDCYEICMRLQIPFMIQHLYFENYEEAVVWICANQLDRGNITEEARKYLIGKRYEVEKILGAHNAAVMNLHTKKEIRNKMLPEPPFGITAARTRELLSDQYNISQASILKYGKYAQALDLISRVVPELFLKILSGEVKISLENTTELSRLSSQEMKRLSQLASDDQIGFAENLRKILPKKRIPVEMPPLTIPAGSVKDMPAYDPDAEILSLALTIPSWISSINRTFCTANLNAVTNNGRSKLEKQLLELGEIIEFMLAAIREEI